MNIGKRRIISDGEMGNRKSDIIDHFVLNEQKRQSWLQIIYNSVKEMN